MKSILLKKDKWIIGTVHPIYGDVQAMGRIDGEQIRWFIGKDGVVSMIPLGMLSYSDK